MTHDMIRLAALGCRSTILKHNPHAVARRDPDPNTRNASGIFARVGEGIAFSSTAAEPGHLLWMCDQIPAFLEANRTDKAFRWLGFLQGALWAFGWRTVEDMKRDNGG